MRPRISSHHFDRLLHRGDRTEVWAARPVAEADRRVVVKIARDSVDPDRVLAVEAELRAEAGVLASVDHPHVVPVIELRTDPAAIVMPWIGGGTLRDLLDERGALTPGQLVAVLEAVGAGLDALAGAGYVHADLKPENILLDDSGLPVLADLGSAHRVGPVRAHGAAGPGVPGDGGDEPPLRSSPAYLAPEVAASGEPSLPGDVWGMAVIAYEALTGRLPHAGEPAEVLALAAAGAHRRLHDWPTVPWAVAEAVEAALGPDPADRPGHVGVFVDRLRASLPETERIELPGRVIRRVTAFRVSDHRTVAVGPRLHVPESGAGVAGRIRSSGIAGSGVRRLSRLLGLDSFVPVASPTEEGPEMRGRPRRDRAGSAVRSGGDVGIVDE